MAMASLRLCCFAGLGDRTWRACTCQVARALSTHAGIASGPHPDTTKLLVFSLRDIHALVLELDDDVTDALSADDGPQYRGGYCPFHTSCLPACLALGTLCPCLGEGMLVLPKSGACCLQTR